MWRALKGRGYKRNASKILKHVVISVGAITATGVCWYAALDMYLEKKIQTPPEFPSTARTMIRTARLADYWDGNDRRAASALRGAISLVRGDDPKDVKQGNATAVLIAKGQLDSYNDLPANFDESLKPKLAELHAQLGGYEYVNAEFDQAKLDFEQALSLGLQSPTLKSLVLQRSADIEYHQLQSLSKSLSRAQFRTLEKMYKQSIALVATSKMNQTGTLYVDSTDTETSPRLVAALRAIGMFYARNSRPKDALPYFVSAFEAIRDSKSDDLAMPFAKPQLKVPSPIGIEDCDQYLLQLYIAECVWATNKKERDYALKLAMKAATSAGLSAASSHDCALCQKSALFTAAAMYRKLGNLQEAETLESSARKVYVPLKSRQSQSLSLLQRQRH
ncbi:hypothetical protein CANCADRAFT_1309 [Tortispora caseinolytica NRRL Y-17796]|uniref:Uncharacterized protein n=1 Tax=Tortispora caseinolytica NRRL Y-17796 TaxID=767744 RepID=A0A1E4TLU0_9ASCO|nr:hypothetical protein CANCADRAFT_1309 [Tortispora caseinolytica NRRL Y-17796]